MEILKFVFIRQECQPANISSANICVDGCNDTDDDDSEAVEAIVRGLEASCACDECGEVARLLGAIFHQAPERSREPQQKRG